MLSIGWSQVGGAGADAAKTPRAVHDAATAVLEALAALMPAAAYVQALATLMAHPRAAMQVSESITMYNTPHRTTFLV